MMKKEFNVVYLRQLFTFSLFLVGCILNIGLYMMADVTPRYGLTKEIVLVFGFVMISVSCIVLYRWVFPFLEKHYLGDI